ncbi:TSUP family transporter, partial [Mycobacterium sp. THU-M116]
MFELTLVLALVVGVVVGILGSGGTVMSVPLLAYVAGMDPKQAIATAHLVVAVTSAVTII